MNKINTDVVYVSRKRFILPIQFWIIKCFDIQKGKSRDKTQTLKLNVTNHKENIERKENKT